MSSPDTAKVTVEDLLPAMLELASIQHDLLLRIERPTASRSFRVRNPLEGIKGPAPVGFDTGTLLTRSRELIQWLLSKIETPGE